MACLSEFGIVLPQKAATVRREAAAHLEDLPGWANTAVGDCLSEVHRLDERLAEYDRHVSQMAGEDERSARLMKLQGVGCTTASALVSTIGDARDFKNGRQLAAWLGLVPGQYSSGGKTRLGGITKAGDGYLRTLLVLGAKSVLAAARNKHDRLSRWAHGARGAARLLEGGHRHRRQERTHGLGGARQGRGLQADRGLSTQHNQFPPPRDDQALMSQGLDPRRESSIMSRRHRSVFSPNEWSPGARLSSGSAATNAAR